MSSKISVFKRQPAWIALIISIALCLWIGSGMLGTEDKKPPEKKASDTALVKVTVERMQATEVTREITLYGRTEPDRMATLRSEVQGKVNAIYVQEGQRVIKGQKLISLDTNDSTNRLAAAKSILKQREVELKAAQSLKEKGYQSQTALAQATANLEMAKADVTANELAISRAEITAPFDGVLNQRFVEVGDLLRDGDKIAEVVDLDPLVISAQVTESNIKGLKLGQAAKGRMVSGDTLQGIIRYISSVSEPGTNTFRIEVAVPNQDYQQIAGMSTELVLPLETSWAVNISPAVMALDEKGNLGVKAVVDEHVKFVPIDIVKSDSEGVWLSGLGQTADVITLGHGFVREGDKVQVEYANEKPQAELNKDM
ncbi:efflux RND transporter periplasmic adaptor subunit [Paraglaciecola sp. 2405UD69-4]|uniref:efflux RND transporter periplasmic adaptor subunit n=1 Tax=Paraglaciecola sp. 2405UD69-4 TaxID=3391836 RepID=UPI0039C90CE9